MMSDKKIRDPNVSNSDLGQWIHDNLPVTMFFIDLDGVVYKKKTGILRIIEQKQPGQALKPSQRVILSFFATAVDLLIAQNIIGKRSGVWVLWGEPPYASVTIQKIPSSEQHTLTHQQFIQFVSGE